jgi:TRAP-type transport system small permease protein
MDRPTVPTSRGLVPAAAAGTVGLLDLSGRLIVVVCLAFMFVALLANVILRYAFGSGIVWAHEIHAILLPWLVGGGIVLATARGRNIAVQLLPDLIGRTGRIWVLALVHGMVIAISLAVLWTGQPIFRASSFQTLSTLGVRQVWGYASLIYAFAGMTVIAAANLVLLAADPDQALTVDTPSSLS